VAQISFTIEADAQLAALIADKGLAKRLKAVHKALGYLELDPRHPGLNSHEFKSLAGTRGEKVWEVYAENKTPAAYRIFWHYGPEADEITIIAITAHP